MVKVQGSHCEYVGVSLQASADTDPFLTDLQKEAPENVKYKVLFCGRHGQGWHNYGAEQYDPVVGISRFQILLNQSDEDLHTTELGTGLHQAERRRKDHLGS